MSVDPNLQANLIHEAHLLVLGLGSIYLIILLIVFRTTWLSIAKSAGRYWREAENGV